MDEVALARLWQLTDGTSCLLLKDARTESWELRVVQGDLTFRSERFANPLIAMEQAKLWRAGFERDRSST